MALIRQFLVLIVAAHVLLAEQCTQSYVAVNIVASTEDPDPGQGCVCADEASSLANTPLGIRRRKPGSQGRGYKESSVFRLRSFYCHPTQHQCARRTPNGQDEPYPGLCGDHAWWG